MDKKNMFYFNIALLMMIFPIYNILVGLVFGGGSMAGIITIADVTASTGLIHTGVIIAIAAGIIQTITGAIGLKNKDKPEKMNGCIFLAVVVMVLYAASQILAYAGGGVHSAMDYIGMIAGFAIPAVFVAAAATNK